MRKFFGRDRVATNASDAVVNGLNSESDTAGNGPEKGVPKQHSHGNYTTRGSDHENLPSTLPSPEAQEGVKKVEGMTLTWTRKELLVAYFFIFLVFFVVSMQQQIQFNLVAYVTSSFAELPLTSTTSILSSVIGGVFRLPIAKFVDLVGRPEGLALMTLFATIGLVMMAACTNVETYCAAQVFYWVGFDGIMYVLDVFMADTSSLKNRALCFAFSTTPYIVTTWVGPPAASSFYHTSGWQWGYGTFAVVTPVIILPFLAITYRNTQKAKRNGLVQREKSGRTFIKSVNYYFWEFDVVGLLLVSAGFSLFLLPFSLASYQSKGWGTGFIIAMIIIGLVCLVVFGPYEKYLAKKSFVPWYLLKEPSVWGACLLSMFLFISFYLWDSYLSPYLQAVHGLDITKAGYVYNIYSIGSCFWAVIFAVLIRVIGTFKWLAMGHLCLLFLGTGLMIHFRQPGYGIGYVVMCQIFIAFGGGGLVISEQMAVMAAAPHANVAPMLALIGLFSSVGGAIGAAVSGAIYTNKFKAALDYALPGNATLNAELYGSLTTQLEYAMGTLERDAVIYAYGDSMYWLTVAGTVFLIPCFLFIAVWKNFKVKELYKAKGTVL